MPIELIAELATNHQGNMDLAKRMIDYAVAGGADTVKTQAYQAESINPADPQAMMLRLAALSEEQHVALKEHAEAQGARYFASVFDIASARLIEKMCGRIKIPSTEATTRWWHVARSCKVYRSWPWRVALDSAGLDDLLVWSVELLTVPLYPAPLEALSRVEWGTGWSDHCVGLSGALYAAAQGATTIEVHVSTPGEGRNCAWDKTQDDLKRLKDWMRECEVIRTGVSRTFRDRWVR